MPSYVLYTLRDLRIGGERQAERALAEAMATRRRSDEEMAQLETRVVEARAARANARAQLGSTVAETAVEARGRLRFWSRLDSELRASAATLALHRAEIAEPAARAELSARAAHLRARQRREVVDRAIARREAAHRRDQGRRDEAAADDLAGRRKT
jgi:flagellar biosynthesis chaperone FliJ